MCSLCVLDLGSWALKDGYLNVKILVCLSLCLSLDSATHQKDRDILKRKIYMHRPNLSIPLGLMQCFIAANIGKQKESINRNQVKHQYNGNEAVFFSIANGCALDTYNRK